MEKLIGRGIFTMIGSNFKTVAQATVCYLKAG